MLGASFDTSAENKAFADAERFGFQLLSDVDRAVGSSYEVARAPGAEHADFAMRIAYLIDPGGTVRRAYEVTDVGGFAAQVLDDLAGLQGPG